MSFVSEIRNSPCVRRVRFLRLYQSSHAPKACPVPKHISRIHTRKRRPCGRVNQFIRGQVCLAIGPCDTCRACRLSAFADSCALCVSQFVWKLLKLNRLCPRLFNFIYNTHAIIDSAQTRRHTDALTPARIAPGVSSGMQEARLERRLARAIEQRGGVAWKLTVPGRRGVQDRLVLMPPGRLWFVEMKTPGKRLRPLQTYRADQLRSLGFHVRTISSDAELISFLAEVDSGAV